MKIIFRPEDWHNKIKPHPTIKGLIRFEPGTGAYYKYEKIPNWKVKKYKIPHDLGIIWISIPDEHRLFLKQLEHENNI